VLRRVSAETPAWLTPGGQLLSETSARQAETAAELLRSAGLAADVVTSDEHEGTVVVGRM
jgi:release factor glutamine methyltransferase